MKITQQIRPLALAAPLTLFAGAAAAQDTGACGQPLALNSPPMVLEATPTETTGGLVELRRNEPRYTELTVKSQMAITLTTLTSERDTTLILFDTDGNVVESDDDSGADSNARLIAMLDPGTYCAQVGVYGGLDASSLVVPFSISAAPPPDACILNAADPVELGPDSEEIITTGVFDENVNLAFRLAAGTVVTIAARSPMFDTFLKVEDKYGREIASDDDGGGDTNSLLDLTSEDGADYCVTLSSLDEDRGIYSMSLSPTSISPQIPGNDQFNSASKAEEAVDAAESAAEAAAEAADAAASAVEDAVQQAAEAAAEAASEAAEAASDAASQ